MHPPIKLNDGEYFVGEFVPTDARKEERIGSETFSWFIVKRKNDFPITVRGQYVRAERDGTISVVYEDGAECNVMAEFSPEEVEGVFSEDDVLVEIRKPA